MRRYRAGSMGRAAEARPIRVAHVATVDSTLRFMLLPQLMRLRDEGFSVAAISAPGPWAADLEAEGIRHIAWPHATRSWNLRADWLALRELLDILRRERFDVVHTHNPKPGVLGRMAARWTGVPCVVNTVHGLYAMPTDSLKKKIPVLGFEWLAARVSDLELYQSEEDLVWARRTHVVPASRSALLGNGCDVTVFDQPTVSVARRAELRASLGIPGTALVVGAVGRLVAEKGFRELFAAARAIRAGMPEVRFLVVGSPDTSKTDAIGDAEIDRAGVDVVFAGWREDVRDLLTIMDVFVLPSWREGVPRSAIEAAAMGRPLVLTDIRGCREVVRDGIDGILVPARDTAALTAAILRLLRDPLLRARFGTAARARAIERFDERRVQESIVVHYRRLLSRAGVTHGDVPMRHTESPAA